MPANVEYFFKSHDSYMDSERNRYYTLKYQLFTDIPNEDPATVSSYIPIALYSPLSSDLAAICKKISVSVVEIGEFSLTYDFDTKPITDEQPEKDDDPTARPWTFTFSSNKTTKVLEKDYSSTPKPVVNTAKCPFDPPITVPAAFPTITITAFKDTFDFADIELYTNSINNAAWPASGPHAGKFAARRLRCVDYGATTIWENNELLYQYTVVLELNPDQDWNPIQVQNVGVLEIKAGKLVNIEEGGIAITSPVPLNSSGAKKTAGSDPDYLDFKGYREVSWAGLL